jgi:amino acid transporter
MYVGAIFGGSRLLQAIARDGLFPFLKVFSFGSLKGDEPRVAVLLSWAIGMCVGLALVLSEHCPQPKLVSLLAVWMSLRPSSRPSFALPTASST